MWLYDDNCYICISIPDVWPGAGVGAGVGAGGSAPVVFTVVGTKILAIYFIKQCKHICMYTLLLGLLYTGGQFQSLHLFNTHA